jgi:hypothetical protein
MATGGSTTSGTFSMSSFSTQSDMFDMSELFSASSIYKGVGASGAPGAASGQAASDVYSGLMVVDSRDGEELLGSEVMQGTLAVMKSCEGGSSEAGGNYGLQTDIPESGPMAKGMLVSDEV